MATARAGRQTPHPAGADGDGPRTHRGQGVAGLQIQEITAQADIAFGSFHSYFASKEEFLEAVITESLSDFASSTITNVSEDTDPAEAMAVACLRVTRLAFDEPDFARLIVNISHSGALFGDAVHPYVRVAIERGVECGRFVVADIEVTLTAVIGGAFALIREILNGRHGSHAPVAFTDHVYVIGHARPRGQGGHRPSPSQPESGRITTRAGSVLGTPTRCC